MWCLGLDAICREVHPTAHVEVLDGPIGEFVTDYLAENGRQILIIGQLSVNDSIPFLGFSDQAWGSVLPFITNLLAHVEATGWGGSNNSNHNRGGRFNYANSITNVAWGASVDAIPTNSPMSPGRPRAAQLHVCDAFFFAGIRSVCGVNLIAVIPW